MAKLIYFDCHRLCFVHHPLQVFFLTSREIFCLLLKLLPNVVEANLPVIKLSPSTITFYLRNMQIKGNYTSQKKMLMHFKKLLRSGDLKLPQLIDLINNSQPRDKQPSIAPLTGVSS